MDSKVNPQSRLDTTAGTARLRLAVAGALLLLAGVIWIVSFDVLIPADADAFDYAQMGRELRRGHGFATLQLFPRQLPWLAERGLLAREHWPNLYRYPVTPLLVAGVMLFVNDPTKAAIIQSGIWYVLAAPLVFLLACRFTRVGIAAACALFYLADPELFDSSRSGLTESFALLLTLVFFLLIPRDAGSRWHWLGIGLVCGLAYLTRTQMLVLLPVALGYAWFRSACRLRTAGLVLLGMLVALSPWMARNLIVTGRPLFSFSESRNVAIEAIPAEFDLEINLHAPISTWDVLRTYGPAISAKIGDNLARVWHLTYWARYFGDWFGPFLVLFVVALCAGPRDPDAGADMTAFRRSTLLLVVLTFVAMAIALQRDRFYFPLRPLILIVACIEGWRQLQRWRAMESSRLLQTAGLAVVLLAGAGLTAYTARTHVIDDAPRVSADRALREAYAALDARVPAAEVIVSDFSFQVVAYTDRRSIRLPRDPAELEPMSQYVEFRYLLLSNLALRKPDPRRPGPHDLYADYVQSDEFHARYELFDRLPNGMMLFRRR